MASITGIAHVGIRVHDMDRSRAFYELLGFEFVVGPVGPEPVAILTHPSGVVINLILNAREPEAPNILMDVPEKHPGFTHFALDVRASGSFCANSGNAAVNGPNLSGG